MQPLVPKKKKKNYWLNATLDYWLVVIMFFTKYGTQTKFKSIVKQFTGNLLPYISK